MVLMPRVAASQAEKGKKYSLGAALLVLLISFIGVGIVGLWGRTLITLIFGHDGHTLERFVAWWCAFSGVTDPAAIATATGTFGALSLLAAVYAVWLLILNVVAHLDRTAGPTN